MIIFLEKFIGEKDVLNKLDVFLTQFLVDLVDWSLFFKLILSYSCKYTDTKCLNDAAFFSHFSEDFIEELKINQITVRAMELVNFSYKIIFERDFQLFNIIVLWKLINVLFLSRLLNFNFIILNPLFFTPSAFLFIHHGLVLLLRMT